MNASKCKSCGAQIVWARTSNDKPIPLDGTPEKRFVISPKTGLAHLIDSYYPHHATCPHGNEWKRKDGRNDNSHT